MPMNEKSLLNSGNQTTHELLHEPMMAVLHLALMGDANMLLN